MEVSAFGQTQFCDSPKTESRKPKTYVEDVMRIMECIGSVTLSHWNPSLTGASWKLAVPLMHAGLNGDESGRTEPVVVYDDMGAGIGSLMAVTESADASTPFYPNSKPIDAYCAALLDAVSVE